MKPSFTLPLIALAALLGVQCHAVANSIEPRPIPPAQGQISLTACSFEGSCSPINVQVPPATSRGVNLFSIVQGGVVENATANGTVTLGPTPSISAAEFGLGTNNGTSAYVYFDYVFEIFDPFGSYDNPLLISTTFSASGALAGQAGDSSLLELNTYNPSPRLTTTLFSDEGSFSVSKHLELLTETLYAVDMSVDLTSYGAMVSGSIDPTITVDPGQLDAAGLPQFDLLFSPNLATPLPSTWIMMVSGLIGLGVFSHRATKKTGSIVTAA